MSYKWGDFCLPVKTKSLTVEGMQHYTPPLQSSTAVTANRVTLPLHMLGVGLRTRTTHTQYRQTTTTHVVLFRRWVDVAVRKDHPDTHVEVVRVPPLETLSARHPRLGPSCRLGHREPPEFRLCNGRRLGSLLDLAMRLSRFCDSSTADDWVVC